MLWHARLKLSYFLFAEAAGWKIYGGDVVCSSSVCIDCRLRLEANSNCHNIRDEWAEGSQKK